MRTFTPYRFSFLSLFLILALSSPPALAQNAKDDWSAAQRINHGSKLLVKTKTGQKYQGRLKAVTDDSLSLSDHKSPGQDIVLSRNEIAEIRKKSGAYTAGMAALMGGLGFAGGYGIGYGIGEARESRFEPEYPMSAVGAAAGAVAGAIIGNKGQVIYKAR
ncbi:MAG: hypothetical protein L0220_02680 [Acidobacteria bacterium]|nr:hypothetical protein [Acidobacteriota bacterium]